MRDKPIFGKNDSNYSITYNARAYSDYIKFFKENNDDVIFLNGKWGSGKTSYLNIILEENKIKFIKLKKKIVKTIDLWRITTNQKTSEICYRTLFPITGFIAKYIFLLFFLILSGLAVYFSSLKTPIISTNSNLSSINTASYFFFISGFLSGMTQILGKIDYDSVFLKLLKIRTKKFFLWRSRIIIIDDFDRVKSSRQEELYKIFNLIINKKIKFVFLADYNSIEKNEGSYLQKIIDRRIELPYELSPSNFWTIYFENIISLIEEKRCDKLSNTETENLESLKNEIIMENRTLREKYTFEKYVDEIIFQDERYDKINIDQQFLIIYLYLFHNNHYSILISKIDKLLNLNTFSFRITIQVDSKKKEDELELIKSKAKEYFPGNNTPTVLILDILLRYDDLIKNTQYTNYKYNDFTTQFPNYLINYIPVNIAGKDIRDIINSSSTREQVLQKIQEYSNSDISDYIRRNQNQLTTWEKNHLFNLAMDFVYHQDYKYPYDKDKNEQIIKDEISKIISFGLYLNTYFYSRNKDEAREYLQKHFIHKLDVSAQLQFYKYYFFIEPKNALESQKADIESVINSDTINDLEYPELIFEYLYQTNKKFTNQQLNSLLLLSDQQFYHFIARNCYVNDMDRIELDSNLSQVDSDKIQKRYTIMDSFYKDKLK
ncbi:P-loop NTPase fold protein [Listeria innocua]|uniref:KAP NTPase domain-containing protein n=1 Tax=Listeria innocua TaxID=1642 RepID=A0AB73H6C3_LISIO|nr:P-loop NTPase fold protein [Listeria innocua]MBC2124504.1 hypothetical protein [Listeria innocua]MBC2129892.1 hypothetical protein [Listeria innocua]MBC2141484.1 hypothetical protein [Listeria innocua]